MPSRGASKHTPESAAPFLQWVAQNPSVLRPQCQMSDINIHDDIMGSIPKVCEVKLGAEGRRLLASSGLASRMESLVSSLYPESKVQ